MEAVLKSRSFDIGLQQRNWDKISDNVDITLGYAAVGFPSQMFRFTTHGCPAWLSCMAVL